MALLTRRNNQPGGALRRRGDWNRLSVRDELNRMFEDVLADWGASAAADAEREFIPSVDVRETKDEWKITAELPGMSEDDVTVEVDDDAVTISGEKQKDEEDEEGGRYWRESAYGSFVRQIPLAADADADKAAARFKKGRLIVTVPKAAGDNSRTRRIDVKGE